MTHSELRKLLIDCRLYVASWQLPDAPAVVARIDAALAEIETEANQPWENTISEPDPHMPHVNATDRALVNRIMFGGTPKDYDRVAAIIAAYREEEIHLALERERQRDNRVYRAIKELLAASTPAERRNLAAGLLVALDRLAERDTARCNQNATDQPPPTT